MKKLLKLFLITILSVVFFTSCFESPTSDDARIILHDHLERRYGEPFAIGSMGIRATDKKMQILSLKST